MKNIYTIIGLVGILIVGAGAYFVSRSNTGGILGILQSTKELIDYVPGELGQVLILTADEDLKTVIEATNDIPSEAFEQVISSIKQLVVYQNNQPAIPVNLLFIQGDDSFDVTMLQELGLVAEGDEYEFRSLSDSIVVYADAGGLAWYDLQQSRFVDEPTAQSFIQAYTQGDYNAGFFSTPEGVEELGGYSALLAGNLESTYLLSSLNTSTPAGKLILQMKDGTIAEPQGTFEPVLSEYYTQSLFYLEIQALKDFVGVDDSQIETFLPLVSGSLGIPLASPGGITELLSSSIAVSVVPSTTSPLGLQAAIIIEGTQHFQTLQSLYPILETLISQNIPLLASGSTLNTIQGTESIISTLPLGDDTQGVGIPVLSLSTDQDTTQLSVFGGPIGKNTETQAYLGEENTVAVFGWDSGLLNQLVGAGLPGGIQSGTLKGTIAVDHTTDQIILSFKQENADLSE